MTALRTRPEARQTPRGSGTFLRSLLGWCFSALIFLGSGEAALRVIYRDEGRTTLGGPGGSGFEHLFMRDELRGRLDVGPRTPGVQRLLIVGDSITWGQGVRDWHHIWTEQLAEALERKNGRVEMAVLARPGRNITEHLRAIEEWGPRVQPDILIYQWYVNDMEVALDRRPENRRRWREWPVHGALVRSSYLYYFFDHQLGELLPARDRTYVDYILQDFVPGTADWAEFERLFHAFAVRAVEHAPRRVILLYPQVPIRGDVYPLQPVHDRMRTLAGPHELSIPPAAWIRLAGTLEQRLDTPWQQAVRLPAGFSGPAIETRDYVVGRGPFTVGLRVMRDAPTDQPAAVEIELVDPAANTVVGHGRVALDAHARGWQQATTAIDLGGRDSRRLRFRLVASGAPLSIASIDLPVDYGFEVVDFTEALKTFNTHASMFDAHPNERAHAVMAQEVFAALERLR